MTNQELMIYEPDEEDELELEEPTLEGKTYIYDPDIEDEDEVFAPRKKRKRTKRRKPSRKSRIVRYIRKKARKVKRKKFSLGRTLGMIFAPVGLLVGLASPITWRASFADKLKASFKYMTDMKFPSPEKLFNRFTTMNVITGAIFSGLVLSLFPKLLTVLNIRLTGMSWIKSLLKALGSGILVGSLLIGLMMASPEDNPNQNNETFSEYDPFR